MIRIETCIDDQDFVVRRLALAWTHSKGKLVKFEKKSFTVILIVHHFKAIYYLGTFQKKYQELSINDVQLLKFFEKVQNFSAKFFDVVFSMTPRGVISYNIVI